MACFLCHSIVSFSQTEIDKSGKVTKLEINEGKISPINVATLDSLDKQTKKDYRDILIKKTDAAIKNINNTTNHLSQFYRWLWGDADVDNIKKDLAALKKVLEDARLSGQTFNVFTQVGDPLKDNLFDSSLNWFSGNPANASAKIKLCLKNGFNQFIISSYNRSYSTASNDVKNFDLEKWIAYTGLLSKQSDTVKRLLAKIYSTRRAGMCIETMQEARNFSDNLESNPDFSEIRGLLKADWFKQWLWFREGRAILDPLDFTTEDYLKKNLQYDSVKARIFDEYISAVIEKYKLYDTVGKVDAFKKILSLKGTGSDQFKLAGIAEAIQKNQDNFKKLVTVNTCLNEISVPDISQNEFVVRTFRKFKATEYAYYNFSYSAKDKFECSFNRKKFLTAAVGTDVEKIISVYNIPAGSDVDIKSDPKPIADRSAFQEVTDTLFSLATQVLGWSTKFAPFASLVDILQPVRVPSVSIGTPRHFIQVYADRHVDLGSITIQKYLEKLLKDSLHIYDKKVFLRTIDNLSDISDTLDSPVNFVFDRFAGSRYSASVSRFLAEYTKQLNIEQNNVFQNLRSDSLHLALMLPIFTTSGLPPGELKPDNNADQPLFYSKSVQTKQSDDPVKMNNTIFGFTKKGDTSKIVTFSYKVGKHYRYQLGAGLAYTLSNYVQTSATEENGGIKVTNTAQQYRLIVGIHVYLGKGLFLQDNSFLGRFNERVSGYIGVGIPKPLENIYPGVAYDLWPGFKATLGAHFYRNDKYTILNNVISEQHLKYKCAGPFFALQIDPSSLLKALGILKN